MTALPSLAEAVAAYVHAPDTNALVLPRWAVDAIAVVPSGARPSYGHGYQERDNAFYKEWDAISRDRDRFTAWLDEHVHGDDGMSENCYSKSEMITIAAARTLTDHDVCFVGIGAPSAACNLARLTHAPGITLIYESGTIGARPEVLHLSIGDGELCETALTTLPVAEMFQYWLQGGRLTPGFHGAAQLDRYGNINTTVIGDYAQPKVRLPGGGGAPEIASACGRTYVTVTHRPRILVDRLPFVTSSGHGLGGAHRHEMWLTTVGPTLVITDLCLLLRRRRRHEGVHHGVPP